MCADTVQAYCWPSAGKQWRKRRGGKVCLHRRQTAWGIVGERKSAGSVSACSNFLLRKRKSTGSYFSPAQLLQTRSKHGKTRNHTSVAVNFFGGTRPSRRSQVRSKISGRLSVNSALLPDWWLVCVRERNNACRVGRAAVIAFQLIVLAVNTFGFLFSASA